MKLAYGSAREAQGAEQTHHDHEYLAAVRFAANPGAQS